MHTIKSKLLMYYFNLSPDAVNNKRFGLILSVDFTPTAILLIVLKVD